VSDRQVSAVSHATKADVTVDADVLKDFVRLADAVTSEHQLHVTESGLTAKGINMANVAGYNVTLPSHATTEWDVGQGQADFETHALSKLLEESDVSGDVQFRRNEEGAWVVKDGVLSLCSIPGEDIGRKLGSMSVEYDSHVVIEAGEIQRALSPMQKMNRVQDLQIRVEYDPDSFGKFRVSTKNGTTGSVYAKFDEDDLIEHAGDDRTKATFAMEYLWPVIEVFDPEQVITVEFSEDYPIRITATLDSGIEAEYTVAPKIVK